MCIWKRALTIVLALIIALLIIPFIVIACLPNDAGGGIPYILYFVICASLCIFLGIVAGADIKRLFWTPFAIAVLFPFCFALVTGDMVWRLFVYSALYLLCTCAIMLVSRYYRTNKESKKK